MNHYITTQEIIEKGNELNIKHQEYKNSTGKERQIKWQEFYSAWQDYRIQVQAYIKTNPIDISDSL